MERSGEDENMVLRLKIRAGIRSVHLLEKSQVILVYKHGSQVLIFPDVKESLSAAAVGVQSRVKASFRRCQFTADKLQGLGQDPAIERLLGPVEGFRVNLSELSVVVEHLFKVRHRPGALGAVTMEASAQLVVNAAQT